MHSKPKVTTIVTRWLIAIFVSIAPFSMIIFLPETTPGYFLVFLMLGWLVIEFIVTKKWLKDKDKLFN